MDPEIKIMEQNDLKAREQIQEIRVRAKLEECSAKYVNNKQGGSNEHTGSY